MINRKRLELVKRNQNFEQENLKQQIIQTRLKLKVVFDLVFFFERQRESVDDRAQNFEQLGDAVVPLSFVHETVENVVDLF